MANKVTGKTDVTGALSTAPIAPKSLVIVGVAGEKQTANKEANTIFSISGTNDAIAAFGEGVASKMVRVLVTNGVNNIKGVIASSADTLGDALEATLADKTIKVVLCLDNVTATISAVKDHLAMAENNDMFRYSVFAPSAENTADQTKLITFAKTVSDNRIFVPGISLFEGDGTTVADPQMVAAGLASAIMTEADDPALPMNGVTIAGFGGVSRVMLGAEMNALVNAGVTPIYPEGTNPAIYRLVTSAVKEDGTADPVWQEGTTRFIADYVLESNSELLRANYKRTKNVARILDSIKGDLQINMEKMVAAEIIENWDASTLTVVKNPEDNYGALVDYEFDVVTPLYTITINQHLKI
jgi:hypothetical protein